VKDAAAQLDPGTTMGAVRLRVSDLDAIAGFYERTIGLEPLGRGDSAATLGAGGKALVELVGDPVAPQRPPRSTGLFHLALLVEDRARLAKALRRVSETGWGLTGASDHLVSEALYTQDPEGNGIEIYRDRPREQWGRQDGNLQMDTLPLDLADLLGEEDPGEPAGMGPGTRMGHVHLNVADIGEAETFYSGVLGFDVTVRGYPGALFVSAGGYHHHLGLNTWNGEGAPPPPQGSRGLDRYEIVVPDAAGVDAIAARLGEAGAESAREDGTLRFADPFANTIVARTA